jgi:hypothetical protein
MLLGEGVTFSLQTMLDFPLGAEFMSDRQTASARGSILKRYSYGWVTLGFFSGKG